MQHYPISSIESIEVLRGPQSSIHGSESIGGVISLSTPVPDKPFEGSLGMTLGSHQTRTLSSYIGSARENSYVTISANHYITDGISSRTDNSEKDGFRNNFVHMKSGGRLSDELDAMGVIIQARTDGEYDNCYSLAPNQCNSEDEKALFGLTLNYAPEGSNLTHKLTLSNARHKRINFKDHKQNNSSSGETLNTGYQGTLHTLATRSQHTTSFAIERETSKVKSGSLSHPRGGKFKLQSISLEHRVDYDDSLFISASARRDKSRGYRVATHDTYRLTSAALLNNAWRVHSSVGTGVKHPTVSELFGWTTTWQPNPDLKPETSKSFDIGLEMNFDSIPWTVDITYFVNKISNLIDPYHCLSNCWGQPDYDASVPSLYQAINQSGESKIKGVELSAQGTLWEHYKVALSATSLRGFDASGEELLRRPSSTASINISRQFHTQNYNTDISLNIRHTGKQSDWNAQLDEFTIVDLIGSVQLSSQIQLIGKIENVFDKTDHEHVKNYNVLGQTFTFGMKYLF